MTRHARQAGDRSAAEDPLARLDAWYARALHEGVVLPDAVCLATATAAGAPSARMVLFKGIERGRILFVTDYRSRKATELDSNPQAALVWHWPALARQIRVEGSVARADPAASDALHARRPRGSRLSAWSSRQSHPIGSREDLIARREAVERRMRTVDDVPRPDFWGGYELTPVRIEFWEERSDRLHHRECFVRDADGGWTVRLLQP